MSVNLQKGQKVDLTKGNTGLKTILVGLGWDEAPRKFSLFSKHEDIDSRRVRYSSPRRNLA